MEATFKFTYVEKYPDEPPLWEINSQENLEDSDVEDILTLLQQQVWTDQDLLDLNRSPVHCLSVSLSCVQDLFSVSLLLIFLDFDCQRRKPILGLNIMTSSVCPSIRIYSVIT